MELQKIIGVNLKNFRKKNKLTQEQLAKKCNISKNAVWNYEKGLTTPSIETLETIAKQFNISIIELMINYDVDFEEEVHTKASAISLINHQKIESMVKIEHILAQLEGIAEENNKAAESADNEITNVATLLFDVFLILAKNYTGFDKLNTIKLTAENETILLNKTLDFLETQLIRIYYEQENNK